MFPTSDQQTTLDDSADFEAKKAESLNLSPQIVASLRSDLQTRIKMMEDIWWAESAGDLIKQVRDSIATKLWGWDIKFYIPLKNFHHDWNTISVTWELQPGKGGKIFTYRVSEDDASLTFEKEESIPRWMA